MSKVDNVMNYIKKVEIGAKLSVRTLAKIQDVSHATAYKALKLMEEEGFIETLPRIGSIRIESEKEKKIESITYKEIIRIVEGELLGGREGAGKTIHRFIIGAMTVEAMKKYLTLGGLIIVGNRNEAHTAALNSGVGVLITGGFKASDKNIKIANKLNLPIISTSHDTFTTAAMINKAISENLIKQTIPYVRDIIKKSPIYLSEEDTVLDYKKISEQTRLERFPVCDSKKRVLGLVTPREVIYKSDNIKLKDVLKKIEITVTPKSTVSYAAHIMDWENLPLCPVTEKGKLVGVITRTDILKTLQERYTKPMETDTIEDKILRTLKFEKKDGKYYYFGVVTPEFLDPLGNASRGVLNMLLSKTVMSILQGRYYSCTLDSISTDFYEPLSIDSEFTIEIEIVKTSKLHSKVNVLLISKNKIISRSNQSIMHSLDS